jgi:hypothetical protein
VDLGIGGGRLFRHVRDVQPLYNWLANIFGNTRAMPQPSPAAADAIPHPSKLTLPTFWISEPAAWFALAGSQVSYQQHHQPESDV